MFAFMFNDYQGPELWQQEEERQRAALRRGFLFTPDEFAAIVALWADVATAKPVHAIDGIQIPTRAGHVEITPTRIEIEQPSPEAMRALMLHIADQWGGKATIDLGASREERLLARAYAEVYGVEMDDKSEGQRDLRLTEAELARLPALRAKVRELHPDAPPARPDDGAQHFSLAASYPNRTPRAA